MKVVADLKYRPKQSARSLAGGRSFLIGLLYYDPSAAFVGGVQQGATLRCREAGYHLVVESLHNDAPDLAMRSTASVSALRPDGMILHAPPAVRPPPGPGRLAREPNPCVLISPAADQPDHPSVRMDDVHAAEEITNLLISLGHTRIAIIKGAKEQVASKRRYQGYLSALKAHKLPLDKDLVVQGDFTFDAGARGRLSAAEPLLASDRGLREQRRHGAGRARRGARLGLAVPGDLSIAGFDDTPSAARVLAALRRRCASRWTTWRASRWTC